MRTSLFAILQSREDEISPRMSDLIVGLYEDWLWLDERIGTVTGEIEMISRREANCRRLMSVPGIGPMISTAVVAAIGTGEAFARGAVTSAPGSAWYHVNTPPEASRSSGASQSGAANTFEPCSSRRRMSF